MQRTFVLCALVATATSTLAGSRSVPALALAAAPVTRPARTIVPPAGDRQVAGDTATGAPEGDPAAACAPASAIAVARPFEETLELEGRLVPSGGQELALWPDTHEGPYRLLEARPHGSFVNAGDRVARFETRGWQERIDEAGHALVAARTAQLGREERARLSEEEEQEARQDADREVARARLGLESWLDHELDLKRRSDELSAQYTQHSIDDALDELRQLEAMYSDDELVEATEEIVLARSRRNLARSRVSQKISEDRRALEARFSTPRVTEDRERAVERAEARRARLAIRQAIARREREQDLERGEREVEKRRLALERLEADGALFELVASRSGVLLHGGPDDFAPGAHRPNYERGDNAPLRKTLFTIAEPSSLALAVSLDQSQRLSVGARRAVTMHVDGRDGEWVGELDLDSFPAADGRFPATVALPKLPAGLVAGMTAKASIQTSAARDAIWLPAKAVEGEGAATHCWVFDSASKSYAKRIVEVLGREGGEVALRADFDAGARVLLGGGAQ